MLEKEREFLEHLLEGEMNEWKSGIDDLGEERAFRVMMTAFTAAAFRQFPGDATATDVAAYVSQLRSRLAAGQDLKTLPTEAALRGVLGQPDAMAGIPLSDILAAQVAVVSAVAHDYPLRGVERETYIAEVLEALD